MRGSKVLEMLYRQYDTGKWLLISAEECGIAPGLWLLSIGWSTVEFLWYLTMIYLHTGMVLHLLYNTARDNASSDSGTVLPTVNC